MKATKTTVASVLFSSVLSLSSAHAQLLIYEPFDYEATGEIDDDDAFFGDGNQAGGFGLEDAWTSLIDRVEMEIWSPGLMFTDEGGNELPVAGQSVFRSGRSGFIVASRPVSPSATAALTADNSTLWMSFLYVDRGFSGPDSSVTLTSEPLTLANNHSLSSPGYGVGILVGETGQASTAKVETGVYLDAVAPTLMQSDLNPNDFENETFLFAAKVNWKPDGELDEIFIFNVTDLTTEPSEEEAIASDTFDMPLAGQQSLAHLNIGETQVDAMDEIRLGLSFADVVSSEVSTRVTPKISSFTSLGGGAWQLALSGQPEGNYEIFSSPTLPFDPPVLVEDLTQGDPADPGTLGGANNSMVTLDEEGVGLVQIDLGDAPRTFLRIQTVLAPGGG